MSSINGTTNSQYVVAKIEYTATANSDNTSTVKADFYIKSDLYHWVVGSGSWYIYIDGVRSSEITKYVYCGPSWVKVGTFTRTVAHNADGTKSLEIKATGGISNTIYTSTTCGETVTLTPIPRASTISSITGDVLAGNDLVVTVSRYNTNYYHKITFKYGNTNVATTNAFATSLTYTIPSSWASYFPNASSGTFTAVLTTYTDSSCTTQIGTDSKTFTVRVPQSGGPTILEGAIGGWSYPNGDFVQGHTRVQVEFDGTKIIPAYGSSIDHYEVEYNGVTTTTSPYITPVLTKSGDENVVKCRVYDTRGLYTEYDLVIHNVHPYSPPTLTEITLCRASDSSGTPSSSGTYLYAKAKLTYASIASPCTLKGYFKTRVGSYDAGTDMTSEQGTVLSSSLSPSTPYIAKIEAVDNFGGKTIYEVPIKTLRRSFMIKRGGRGAAFFGIPQTDDELTVYGDVNASNGALKGYSANVGNGGITTTGNITGVDVSAENITASGDVDVTGDVSADSATIGNTGITTTGPVSGKATSVTTLSATGNITSAGTVSGDALSATNGISGKGATIGTDGISSTGNISTTKKLIGKKVEAGTDGISSSGQITTTNNISANGSIHADGNMTTDANLSAGGDIHTTNGDVYTTNGDIYSTNGEVRGKSLSAGANGISSVGGISTNAGISALGNADISGGVTSDTLNTGVAHISSLYLNNTRVKATLASDLSWASGTKTIAGISNYLLLAVKLVGESTYIPCINMGGHIRGGTVFANASNLDISFSFVATISGNAVTLVRSGYIKHSTSSPYHAWTSVNVEEIVGIL